MKDVFEKWQRDKALIRAEFTSGNISVVFTGQVSYQSSTELRLSKFDDEISISLFCAQLDYFDKINGNKKAKIHFKQNYVCAIRIVTDAQVTCMVYELREHIKNVIVQK